MAFAWGGMALNKWDQCTWLNENTNQGISMVLEASQGIVENGFFGVTGGSTNNVQLGFSGGPLEFRHCSIEGWGTNRPANFLEFKTGGGIFQDISIRNCLLMSPIQGEDNTTVTGLRIENNAWWPTGTNLNLGILRNSYIQGGGYPQDGSGYVSESGTNVGTWVVRQLSDNNTWVNVWPTNVLGTEQHNSSILTPEANLNLNGIASKTVYSPRYIGTTPYVEVPISGEMLTNGDCSATNGWWTTAGLGNQIIAVPGGLVGNCLLVTNGVLAQGGVAEQNLITEIGGTYKVSAYGRIDGTNTYGWTFSVGTNGGIGIDLLLCPIQKSTSWTLLTGIFDATTVDPLLQLRCYDTNATAHAYFDSVSVVRIPGGNVMARGLFTGAGGTNGLKVLSSGYVGVGTNNPQYLLDVNGVLHFQGAPTFIINDGPAMWKSANYGLVIEGHTGAIYEFMLAAEDGTPIIGVFPDSTTVYFTGTTRVDGGTVYLTNTVPALVTAAVLGVGGHWVGNSNGFLVDIYSLDGATTAMKVLAP